MRQEQLIKELKELIHLDIDAVNAYNQTIDEIEREDIKLKIIAFRDEHKNHIDVLSQELVSLGEKAPAGKDTKGFFLEGFTKIRSMTGTKGALEAMKINEKLTNKKYEEAVKKFKGTAQLELIEKFREDERKHLEYINQGLHYYEEHKAA
ncbi:MAG: ferritin-like domain-containing protein [Bacteriovoracia bacterium]